jgi:hypothetical protein
MFNNSSGYGIGDFHEAMEELEYPGGLGTRK